MRNWMMFFVCTLAVTGCNIRVNEAGNDWGDEWEHDGWEDNRSLEERAADVCDPYCIDLIDCGVLSDSAFISCRDLCMDRFEDDEDAVTEGCACIQAAQCSSRAASDCKGDPLPGILEESPEEEGNSGVGGASGGGDYSVGECATNHDCGLGEDCVGGSCLARCAASCQCEEGLACVAGYCDDPEEPAETCDSDCDCTSGLRCVEGRCE